MIDTLSNPGVTHLVVHRDAALDPRGDEITADIARESANDVIEALKALGVKERGAITLDVVDTVLSARAFRAEERAVGDPADAVVWDELAARTREESTLNVTYMTFLCLACLIAAVGVVTDSPVTVVGAMVVSPIPDRWPRWRWRCAGGRRLARRAALALLAASGCHGGHRDLCAGRQRSSADPVTSTRELEEVDFISSRAAVVNRRVVCRRRRDAVVGVAKSAALVGVFISVTTVPAAGFAVVAATVGDWDIAAQSAAQLAINLAGIVLAGVLVLWMRRTADRRHWHMIG